MPTTSMAPSAEPALPPPGAASASPRRVLWLSCLAHALHDGYTDMIYVLLPVWQSEFALGYAALATLRGIYAGAMAALQLPSGVLARRLGSRSVLALGTLLAALGYGLAGLSGSLVGLCAALALSGIGSSTQHPLASGAVTRAYGRQARGPLSIYNFAGDLGKAALPAALSLLVTWMPWRHSLWILSAVGVLVAASLALFLPALALGAQVKDRGGAKASDASAHRPSKAGFQLLFAIGALDTAVRMGLLTFLPFLLKDKGGSQATVGLGLALVFIGGAAGKFACGWIGARLGVVGTVMATEGGTAAAIVAVWLCPLLPAMVLLPLLGVMLNGTSSVLYGTVPELSEPDATERAFALFYTGVIGSGAIAPVLYGAMGDHFGVDGATLATAATALLIFPLVIALRPHLLPESR